MSGTGSANSRGSSEDPAANHSDTLHIITKAEGRRMSDPILNLRWGSRGPSHLGWRIGASCALPPFALQFEREVSSSRFRLAAPPNYSTLARQMFALLHERTCHQQLQEREGWRQSYSRHTLECRQLAWQRRRDISSQSASVDRAGCFPSLCNPYSQRSFDYSASTLASSGNGSSSTGPCLRATIRWRCGTSFQCARSVSSGSETTTTFSAASR